MGALWLKKDSQSCHIFTNLTCILFLLLYAPCQISCDKSRNNLETKVFVLDENLSFWSCRDVPPEPSKPIPYQPWAPSGYTAFKTLLSVRLCAGIWSNISDCDETYNYWEPVWWLMLCWPFILLDQSFIHVHNNSVLTSSWKKEENKDELEDINLLLEVYIGNRWSQTLSHWGCSLMHTLISLCVINL